MLLGQVPERSAWTSAPSVRRAAGLTGRPRGRSRELHAALGIVALVSGALAALLYWQAPSLSESFFHKPAATDLVRLAALALRLWP